MNHSLIIWFGWEPSVQICMRAPEAPHDFSRRWQHCKKIFICHTILVYMLLYMCLAGGEVIQLTIPNKVGTVSKRQINNMWSSINHFCRHLYTICAYRRTLYLLFHLVKVRDFCMLLILNLMPATRLKQEGTGATKRQETCKNAQKTPV